MKLGMQVSLGPGDFVLDGDPVPLHKKGAEPPHNFRPMSLVTKRLNGSIALGMELGLGPATLCSMRTRFPSETNGTAPTQFFPCLLWLNG